MVPKDKILEIFDGYDREEITVATLCSHSSLQIFHGARQEGFNTLGIAVDHNTEFYDAFPLAKPDEILRLDDYDSLVDNVSEITDRNAIIIPHGSFVEYLGPERFEKMEAPTYGNRSVLNWESDRAKEREWLESAGIEMPREVDNAKQIDRPVLIKYHGAKGGRGFFIAKDYPDFKLGIDHTQPYTIQEYILGTRYYLHYFYSPIRNTGYQVNDGEMQLLSIDRRDESNIDEMYKLGAQEELKKHGLFPSFVVTGNIPVVVRESLLPKIFDMGKRVVKRSQELFGGIVGPFCLESIVTDKLEFKVFEISSRIVAGTNPFISGSSYSDMIEPGMSTGKRISKELKLAMEKGQMGRIIS